MAWLVALEKAPRVPVILGSIGVSLAIAGLCSALLASRGEKPHTLSDDWKAANKDYMRFQKMNPIFGASKGL